MNKIPDHELQTQLRELLGHYQTTLHSLELLENLASDEELPTDVTNELQQIMLSIRSNEPTYRAVVDAWKGGKPSPSPDSRRLRADVEHTLGQLVEKVTQLEKNTERARSRLVPKLNHAARGHKANTAYRKGDSCR